MLTIDLTNKDIKFDKVDDFNFKLMPIPEMLKNNSEKKISIKKDEISWVLYNYNIEYDQYNEEVSLFPQCYSCGKSNEGKYNKAVILLNTLTVSKKSLNIKINIGDAVLQIIIDGMNKKISIEKKKK